MKQLILIALLAVSGWGATGDISNITVNPDGWNLNLTIAGVGDSGSWNFGLNTDNTPTASTPYLIVRRLGFTSSGELTTVDDTVWMTEQLRKVYPNNLVDSIVEADGNVTATIALSAPVFTKDTIKAVSISAGLYTHGTASNTLITSSATNNSAAVYPKVIGNWSYPGRSVVIGNFTVRGCFVHQSARSGKMVQAVRFTATDQHSHTYSTVVSSATIDSVMTNRGGNPVIEYIGTIDVSGFTAGDIVTVNFTAFPVWGDSLYSGDGVNTFPTPLYASQTYKLVADRYVTVVDTNAVDNNSGQAVLESVFDLQTPPTAFKNIYAAINAIRTAMGTADIAGGIVYLRTGDHGRYGGTITTGTSATFWFELRNFPNESPAIDTVTGSNQFPVNSYIKYQGITIKYTTSANFAYNESGTWFDRCADNRTGGQLIYQSSVNYLTHSAINKGQDFPYSTQNDPVCIARGCAWNYAGGWLAPYVVLGNETVGGRSFTLPTQYSPQMTIAQPQNIIIAYNYLSRNEDFATMYGTEACDHGLALIQNVFEKRTTTSPLMRLAADGSTSSPVNNVLLWHNTFVGERLNYAYNDYNLNGVTPPATRLYWSIKNNIFHRVSTVADIDPHGGTAGAPRNGNWSVRYGVQRSGNIIAVQVYDNEFWGFKAKNPNLTFAQNSTTIQNYIKFINDKSYIGSNDGFGDYHLTTGSEAIGNAYDYILPYDLDGDVRTLGGASGAYEFESNAPPTITAQPQSDSIALGSDVVLSVTATGTAPISYQWQVKTGTWQDSGNATGSTFTVNGPDTGVHTYRVIVSNAFGADTSDSAVITVYWPEFDIDTSIVGSGTIALSPAGLTQDSGTVITATGTAAEGWAGDTSFTFTLVRDTAITFTFLQIPAIDSIRPNPWYYGKVIDIYGAGFGDVQGKLIIDTDTLIRAALWTDTHITDTIPADMSRGFKPVKITNSNNLTGTAQDLLRVLRPYAR